MKRQIAQLKKDKLVHRGGGNLANVDEMLDGMIDENFKLQEEERQLMTAVKKLQLKKHAGFSGASAKVKKLTKTIGTKSRSRSRSPLKHQNGGNRSEYSGVSSHQEFIMDMQNMRSNIEHSNHTIQELKMDIEMGRKANSGQIPSQDLIDELRKRELQCAQSKARRDDLIDTLKVKEVMFQESKNLQQGFLDELKALDTQKLALQKESRVFEEAAKDVEFLAKRIEESRDERNRLQKEFDVVTR